jgi:hypothetical protein
MKRQNITYIVKQVTPFKGILISLIGAVLVFSTSCSKDPFPNFALTAGKTVTVTRPVDGNFTKIQLNDDVNLVITQGNSYNISVEGGEKILSGIETSISDSTLTISNHNTFNWLRSYDNKFTAHVTMPHLLQFDYKSIGTVTSTDTIREDSLFINGNGGSGYIKLVINTGSSHLSLNEGSADMDISGKTGVNYIYSNSYGPFHCQDLKAVYTFINTNSTNDCYISVSYYLEYIITSLGNIYYSGNPQLAPITLTGEGKLIKLE